MIITTHRVITSGKNIRIVKAQTEEQPGQAVDNGRYETEKHPMFGGESDWQFSDGPGGVIYLGNKPTKSLIQGIVNFVKNKTGKGHYNRNRIEKDIFDFEEEQRSAGNEITLGYYLSKDGDDKSDRDELLSGTSTVFIGNISKDTLFQIAKKLEDSFDGVVYVEFLGNSGTIYTADGQQAKSNANSFAKMRRGQSALLIMSVDKNERNKVYQKLRDKNTGEIVPKVNLDNMDSVKQSLSGWFQTINQRMFGKERNIADTGKDVAPLARFEIFNPGHGGYVERGGFEKNDQFSGELSQERSFAVRVFNVGDLSIEKVARSLAKKFSQYSVLIIFRTGERKMVSGLLGQEKEVSIASVYSRILTASKK